MLHVTDQFPKDEAHLIPATYGRRLFLFQMRRMASAGVNDAHAANAMIGAFGRSYRRPLILSRAMMLEIARISGRRIMVAPCCCARMTRDEAAFMAVAADAITQPAVAYRRLATLLDQDQVLGALTCMQAVAQAYADLGHGLSD